MRILLRPQPCILELAAGSFAQVYQHYGLIRLTFVAMKKILLCGLFFMAACNEKNKESENDIDAARNFIKASLERDWPKAQDYMLQDSANMERLDKIEAFYINESREDREGY